MKTVFWTVFVLAFAACTAFGIGPVLKRTGGDWTSAPMLAGVVLGLAIIAVAVLFAAGIRPAILPSDSAMVYALVGLAGAKVVVGLLATAGVFGRG